MEQHYRTRAVVVPLDPSPSQEQLLRSYCGAARFAYNWTITTVQENLALRARERTDDVAEADLTKLSWHAFALTPLWNASKDGVAPWHRDVTMHAFRSGVTNAANALKNFNESKKGKRRGLLVGFPKRKNRHSKLSVTFTDIGLQSGWFSVDSRHIRLILPRNATDPRITRHRSQLQWLHTTESLRRLKTKVVSREWSIQSMTISFTGGRWQAAFSVRQPLITSEVNRHVRPLVGVDLGVKHLATLSVPVSGVSDKHGHVTNPRLLDRELDRLACLNRQLARSVKGSKNRAKILKRRQLLYGRVTRTRALYLHRITTTLAERFETVVLEDLHVVGMVNSKTPTTSATARLVLDASFYELRRQLTYKTTDRGHRVIAVNRFYPSSKKCSHCGETKAKLARGERIFECSNCGVSLDRDVNAARNIHAEGQRLIANEVLNVAGHEPETLNADSRSHKTRAHTCEGRDRYESRTTQPFSELSLSV